jgi:hypothetical protein
MATSLRANPDQSTGYFNVVEGVEVGRFGGPSVASATSPQYRSQTVAKVPLAAVDSAGGILAWQPDSKSYGAVIVLDMIIDVTTNSTGACTVSAGIAANATTLSSTLISGQSVASTGSFISTNAGHLPAGQYITISTASGASAGLVGYAYITFLAA